MKPILISHGPNGETAIVLFEDYLKLQAQAEMLAEVVQFYADKYNWVRQPDADIAQSICTEDCSNVEGYAEYTGGDKAREALDKYTKFKLDTY